MASFTGSYSFDVFVSYGQIDNTDLWVTDFHTRLKQRLTELLGAEVEIWRDTRLEHVGDFDKQLRETICDSALFLSILTPRYLQSPSCKEELDLFVAGSDPRGSRLSIESRLIRVGKTWLRDQPEPPNFASSLGFKFYEQDPQNPENFHEFGSRENRPRFDRFSEVLDSLAQAAARQLIKMRRTSPVAQENGKVIFLAPTPNDLRLRRESIQSELKGRGHTVLSCDPLPETGPELRAQVAALLEKAEVSLHLAGGRYGIKPEQEDQSYGEIVYGLASARRSRPGFHQLVWIPEGLESVDPMQQTFLAKVCYVADARDSGKSEVFQTSFESFKEGVLDFLSSKHEPDIPPDFKAKAVYLLCDHSDLKHEHLDKIKAYLRERGHPVELPAFEGDPNVLRAQEEELIADTDATLIYYGKTKDSWVAGERRRIRKILSSSGIQRTGYQRALYLATPKDELKAANYLGGNGYYPEPGFPPLLLLGDCGEFRPEALEPLIQVLER